MKCGSSNGVSGQCVGEDKESEGGTEVGEP